MRAVGSTPGPYPGIRLPRTSPIPGQVVTLDNVCVGLVVRRGPDWDKIHTNFMEAGVDGGPGNDGVVTDVSKAGRYASVRWNATGETSYIAATSPASPNTTSWWWRRRRRSGGSGHGSGCGASSDRCTVHEEVVAALNKRHALAVAWHWGIGV